MATESVRKQIVVSVSQEKAFKTFTEKFDRWWPRSHHIGVTDMKNAYIEPKVNGRWYEVGTDGAQCDWGKVLAWDPYNGFTLAWQISAQWKYDPHLHTEVEVRFQKQGENQTLVTLVHRKLENFGAAAADMKKSFDSDGGWNGILKAFAEGTI